MRGMFEKVTFSNWNYFSQKQVVKYETPLRMILQKRRRAALPSTRINKDIEHSVKGFKTLPLYLAML